MDWFQIGKGVHQGCILSPCLFNFYSQHIIRNVRLDDSQAGIKIARIHVDVWQKTTKFCKANILQLKNKFKRKIARRNINNLRYAEDNTLMIESNEELKSLLMKVKEESEKDGFKLNSHKTKIVASGPITLWLRSGTSRSSERLSFLGLQDHCGHEIKRYLPLGRKVMTKCI